MALPVSGPLQVAARPEHGKKRKAGLGRQSSSGGTPTGRLLKGVKSPKHPFDTASVGLQTLFFLPDLPEAACPSGTTHPT